MPSLPARPVSKASRLRGLGLAALLAAGCQAPAPNPAPPKAGAVAVPATSQADAGERFDDRVRDDFFAGFQGDAAALARGMAECDRALAADPKHAEALVWHGAGALFQAGELFQGGHFVKGMLLWRKALGEMDRAVALAPDNIAVRIPRGAAVLPASRFVPAGQAPALIERGLADYERVLQIQEPYFTRVPLHSRGELLFGLADGYYRLGDTEKSRAYLRRVEADCAGSAYARRAAAWLAETDARALKRRSDALNCIGCHVR